MQNKVFKAEDSPLIFRKYMYLLICLLLLLATTSICLLYWQENNLQKIDNKAHLYNHVTALNSVRIMLHDLNGPKGGVDKHCKVLISIRPSFNIIIEETDAFLEAAINRALDRAGRTVARRIDQIMDRRRS